MDEKITIRVDSAVPPFVQMAPGLMDHSPIRQTFELRKFISTARKSVLNLVKLGSLVAKYRKVWKIQSCEICEFCML